MKKLTLLLILLFLISSCNNTDPLPPNTYQINGSVKGIYNGIRTHIKHIDHNRRETIIDTAIIMNEVFSFNGKINNASIYVLTINGINGNVPFVLESGKINMEIYKDSIFYSTVSGSKNNDDYNLFKIEHKKRSKKINEIMQEINLAREAGNATLFSELASKSTAMSKDLVIFAHDYIAQHPDSDFSLMLLEKLIIGSNQDSEKFKNSLAVLKNVVNKNIGNRRVGQQIETFIYNLDAKNSIKIGKVAPNFSSTTPNGDTLSLNDIKGKATIIDFWASWCKPCRIENPNVVRTYNKYHDKGLEIISVSLDREGQKERWLKAIEDDNMDWHHVSNLKFWNDPIAKLYNITSIPATFILDKEGKIVAKKLRGDALEKQIAELLDL